MCYKHSQLKSRTFPGFKRLIHLSMMSMERSEVMMLSITLFNKAKRRVVILFPTAISLICERVSSSPKLTQEPMNQTLLDLTVRS